MSSIEITRNNTHNGLRISDDVAVKKFAQLSEDEQLLATRADVGSEAEKKLLAFLDEYKSVMNTKVELGDVGNDMQYRLYRTYVDLIDKKPANEFRSLWALLLLYAKVNRGTVFGPDMINRFSQLWTLGEQKLFGFQMVNNIILLTADNATRARNVRFQLDFGKSLDKYFTAEGVQKVISFYKS